MPVSRNFKCTIIYAEEDKAVRYGKPIPYFHFTPLIHAEGRLDKELYLFFKTITKIISTLLENVCLSKIPDSETGISG